MEEVKKKLTSTKNIANLFNKGMVTMQSAEYLYKSFPGENPEIADTKELEDNVKSLAQSGIFADSVEWHYQLTSHISDTEDFIITGDCNDALAGTVVIMFVCVADGFTLEDVEKQLNQTIFDVIEGGKKYE